MSARILTADIERIPMLTKQIPVWSLKGLKDRWLRPDQIERWSRTVCMAYAWGDDDVEFIAEWQAGGRREFLERARTLLHEADIFSGHNSQGFDYPHLVGDMIAEGDMWLPDEPKHIDTLLILRRRTNLDALHLDAITKRFGLSSKTDRYRMETAERAVAGDKDAQAEIEAYNRGDVVASRDLRKYLQAVQPVNLGLFNEDPTILACPHCNSIDYQRRGFRVKNALRYRRYQCQTCQGWFTDRNAIKGLAVEGRP